MMEAYSDLITLWNTKCYTFLETSDLGELFGWIIEDN